MSQPRPARRARSAGRDAGTMRPPRGARRVTTEPGAFVMLAQSTRLRPQWCAIVAPDDISTIQWWEWLAHRAVPAPEPDSGPSLPQPPPSLFSMREVLSPSRGSWPKTVVRCAAPQTPPRPVGQACAIPPPPPRSPRQAHSAQATSKEGARSRWPDGPTGVSHARRPPVLADHEYEPPLSRSLARRRRRRATEGEGAEPRARRQVAGEGSAQESPRTPAHSFGPTNGRREGRHVPCKAALPP